MEPRVIATCLRNGGVLTRTQLLDLGVAPGEIQRLVRCGHLVRLRRGAYTTAQIWQEADEYVGRPLLHARAAVALMRRGWVLSHESGAYEHGLEILRPPEQNVHVTRPGWTNAWTENGVKHHLARYREDQVVQPGRYPVHDLARIAVDIGREHGDLHGLVACDSAMRRGVRKEELVEAAEVMKQWPGGRAARSSAAAADGGAATVLESLARHLVREAGIGEPETQFPVRTSEGIRWSDLRVGNHIIESDGRVKVTPTTAGGVAIRPASEVLFEERKRERLVKDRGLVVSRLYWDDHWGSRRTAALRKLQADHEESVRLYGAELDPRLALEAEQIRREHGWRSS